MSEYRQAANQRRNTRQTKIEAFRAPSVNSRDTKKWCRGKVGTAHKPVCMSYNELKNTSSAYAGAWRVLVCTGCGKQLAHWWPSPFRTVDKAPDWVT